MKLTSNLFAAGAIALVAGVFSACGGGSGANIPTDGLLGEVPSVAAKYLPEINELQEKRWHSASEENREEIARKEDALKAEWSEAIKAAPSIEGVEIPLEVAADVPIRPDGNLKITLVTIKDDDVTIKAETTAAYTAETPCTEDFRMVAYDSDGKAILHRGGSVCSGIPDSEINWKSGGNASYKVGAKGKVIFTTSSQKGTIWKDAEAWAKLAKVVIMNVKSDAFKKVDEQIKAAEEAAKKQEK
jgi:hypothetical protein